LVKPIFVETITQTTNMDMRELLSIASLMDDDHVSRVYARASLCYAKWGDTSDYSELFDLVMF
jgi:hypothetical protein